ncbi:MAG: type I restriction endonuclease subunit R [Deltaproteobacteria bacterium]|nr:type I restriction endonuclease subunit R [Deltaproteobacteria bacterium]
MKTNTSEAGLEAVILRAMTGRTDALSPTYPATETAGPVAGGTGWLLGDAKHYEREYAVDLVQLRGFLGATQEHLVEPLSLAVEGPTRHKFLARLQGEITKRGVIDVLRKGIEHGAHHLDLFYGTPTAGNTKAEERFKSNRFSVSRQLRYSKSNPGLALDLCLFINGLPVATFELKNSLTKQTVADAVVQYKRDRDPTELLFSLGRCIVHFAVDDHEVEFCTELKGKASWFLPFNQGSNDGAGNPPNPDGLKTDYLWKRILTPAGLTNIIESYAQIIQEKDEKTGKKRRRQVFPRFHQLEVVRRLLTHAREHGVGHRYLIQHSAGSGKSNSITWLSHQLVGLEHEGKPVFDSIFVITDRRILDKQIRDNIKNFAQVTATIGAVTEGSAQLRQFVEGGKKIIISTVQKFPFILEELGAAHRQRTFALIIDEAHSSQGGKTSAAVNIALSQVGEEPEEEDTEDKINRLMEARGLLPNASYFAFTATPKNKTLETFGLPYFEGDTRKFRPFHSYTMKQAIQEGFIMDVLKSYTPVNSYYKLVKTIEDDPKFDTKKAQRKLRHYVESHDYAIRLKAEIMVDHFHDQVIAKNKVGGRARAMVVCSSIDRAIQYHRHIGAYLKERKSPYQSIVAFSGEKELDLEGNGTTTKATEATLNGFPSAQIPERIQEDPYRFLVCADKFQTGYDEPLLHTMYVDKPLSGVKAVQTLSRLNRAHPEKRDVFVLDFQNKSETITESFAEYYRTTLLSSETDPNKLHDLKAELDGHQVYSDEQIDQLVALYLGGAPREQLDPILDACVATYKEELDEDGQVNFKGNAKAFVRTYEFLAGLLDYKNARWEKLSIFLRFLVPKLPAPKEEDLSKGILDAIDMDSYRVEKKATMKIVLADEDAEIGPVPVSGGGHKPEPELDLLSTILSSFNDLYGKIDWADSDRVRKLITEDIPAKVAADEAYKNARANSDAQNARIEHDKALGRVMMGVLKDDTELFKMFSDNEGFKRWLSDTVFRLTYTATTAAGPQQP